MVIAARGNLIVLPCKFIFVVGKFTFLCEISQENDDRLMIKPRDDLFVALLPSDKNKKRGFEPDLDTTIYAMIEYNKRMSKSL